MVTRLLLFTDKEHLGDIAMLDLNGTTEFTGIPGSYNGETGLMCVYNYPPAKFLEQFQQIVPRFVMFIVDTSTKTWTIREVANAQLSDTYFRGPLSDLDYSVTTNPSDITEKYIEVQDEELSFSLMCAATHDLLVHAGAIRGLTMQQQTEIMLKKVQEEAERQRALIN